MKTLQSMIDWCNGLLSDPSQLGIVFLALIYVSLVVGVRWQMIARPMRNGIETRLKLLEVDANHVNAATEDQPERLIALEITKSALSECKRWNLLEILFWSRGKETSLWQRIDKAEGLLAYTWPIEKLIVRLESMSARLEKLATTLEARQLRERIAHRIALLDRDKPQETTRGRLELAELYREAVRVERASLVNEDIESDYFNNKMLWNILIALAAIVIIANVAPVLTTSLLVPSGTKVDLEAEELRSRHIFMLLLLAGAVGGILSRLTRALRLGLSRTEQGTSWMAMFMSPLVGALAGWAGCILLIAAHELQLILPNVQGADVGALLVSAAVLFGFSERMFIGIAEKLESNVLAPRAESNAEPVSEASAK